MSKERKKSEEVSDEVPVSQVEVSPPDQPASDVHTKEVVARKEINKVNKKSVTSAVSLSEFLRRFIESKGKVLPQDRKIFDKLDRDLTEEKQVELVDLFLEIDSDLKYCLILADFLLEGSRNSSIRIQTLDFIERVVSGYSIFSGINNNSVLGTWLVSSKGGSDTLGFFENNLRDLCVPESKGKKKHFTEAQVATLLCISAVWLYFKRESDFSTLMQYLSRSAFSTEGQSSGQIEPQAFSFATSMFLSNKRKNFGYFLQLVSEKERVLSQKLTEKTTESTNRNEKISSLNINNIELEEKNYRLKCEMDSLEGRVKILEGEVLEYREKARHRDTYHEDEQNSLRIKLRNVLDGELKDVLEKAQKANEKGKREIVDYQIDDALAILKRELKKVESNA